MRNIKDMFSSKILLTMGVILTIFLIILVIIDINRRSSKDADKVVYPDVPSFIAEETPKQAFDPSIFRSEVPEDIIVPDMDTDPQVLAAKDIAPPSVIASAAAGSDSRLSIFNIKADQGKYSPSNIVAYVGDTVHINFTAVDKDYDIVFPNYNMTQSVKQGQTKSLEFQALQEGNFLYYCESCGGPNSQTTGHIMIVNK